VDLLVRDLKRDRNPEDSLEEGREVAAKKKTSAKKKTTAKRRAVPKKAATGKGRGAKAGSSKGQAGVVYSDVRRQFRSQLLSRLR
jgi:hypothetical protein